MDTLIRTINKIQDQFRSLKEDPIALPQIVVVGSQSAGKSSVLESLVQRSFLPRGSGIVTRCPLILQLFHCPENDERRNAAQGTTWQHIKEWGEFLHAEGRIFQMGEIREEIERRTEVLAGVNKNICSTPITLRVFSPSVLTLTLVDLPGITKVNVADQPVDIEKQIRDLIDSFIENKLSIILAVVTANTDMATNDCLQIAKKTDPEGERTLAVVTKLDLMDKGTNATKMLTGKDIPVKLGIIGVVNRSQEDIITKKTIKQALKDEEEFLRKQYPALAAKNGTAYLAKALQELLTSHIKKSLPGIMEKFSERVRQCQFDLDECGEDVTDDKKTLANIISEFTKTFHDKLSGNGVDVRSPILIGGSQICHIFEQLKKRFDNVEPCISYCLEEVVMAVKNTNGPRPPFIVSEPAFEALVKPLIQDLLTPSIHCVEDVMKELENVCRESVPKEANIRFPRVKQEITTIVDGMIAEYSVKTKELVKEAVLIELGHISYSHFDKFKEDDMQIILAIKPGSSCGPSEQYLNTTKLPFEAKPAYVESLKASCSSKEARFDESLLRTSFQDKKHILILGKMLNSYYKVVSDKVQDSVSKTIMTYLVNSIKDDVQTQLTLKLFSVIKTLFEEEELITARRIEKTKELMALTNSIRALNVIADSH